MKKLILLTALIVNSAGSVVMAHQGHDHDAPTTLKAPKGGIIKALDEARVEVVSKGSDIKVYVYDKAMKPAASSRFLIAATAVLPRTKTEANVKLIPKDFHFEGNYDAKGSHRFTLKLAVTDLTTKRTDNITFTIEPRN